jgi:2-hydroxychromene-2-carboxylate isomerase
MGALGERTGTPVRWRPFLLGGVFKATGNEMPAAVEAKARYMQRDLERWARYYGVPYRFPSRFPLNTLPAQRALVAAERSGGQAAVQGLAQRLFEAYWAEDRDVSAEAELRRTAEGAGLDPDALAQAAGEQAIKDQLRQITDEAVRRGAFGAPTIFVGDEMFWGNDRLFFVEELLRG